MTEEQDEASVAFSDLPVYEATETALENVEALTAAIVEMRERLTTGHFGSDARYDIAVDLYELTSKLQAFALGVLS